MYLFKRHLICPHCKHEFYAPILRGAQRVHRGNLFICPECDRAFSLAEAQFLIPRAKQWPFWKVVIMMVGVVISFMAPLIFLSWIFSPLTSGHRPGLSEYLWDISKQGVEFLWHLFLWEHRKWHSYGAGSKTSVVFSHPYCLSCWIYWQYITNRF